MKQMFCDLYVLITNAMIFLMDMLDSENLKDMMYKWPFYLTLRDSEPKSLGDQVDDTKH
jgi:hypothetical protein